MGWGSAPPPAFLEGRGARGTKEGPFQEVPRCKDVDKSMIMEALARVVEPDLGQDLVSLGLVGQVEVSGEEVQVALEILNPSRERRQELEQEVRRVLQEAGAESVRLDFSLAIPSTRPPLAGSLLEGVKNVVAVASGKGGVGKSTVAVNLALALHAEGARVGLLDVDVYGPSIPALMGLKREDLGTDGRQILPAERFGLKIMSMGLLMEEGEAVIWRGPMLHGVVRQFLEEVAWGDLDYLILDLPPGTGDVQLSLCQTVPLGGAVVVSTPQDVALGVAVKAINMFEKLNTPVVGILENMSTYVCPHCGQRDDVFGHGGAAQASSRLGIPFLGGVPLESRVRRAGDEGKPVVLADPGSPASQALLRAARLLAGRLVVAARQGYEDLLGTMPRA